MHHSPKEATTSSPHLIGRTQACGAHAQRRGVLVLRALRRGHQTIPERRVVLLRGRRRARPPCPGPEHGTGPPRCTWAPRGAASGRVPTTLIPAIVTGRVTRRPPKIMPEPSCGHGAPPAPKARTSPAKVATLKAPSSSPPAPASAAAACSTPDTTCAAGALSTARDLVQNGAKGQHCYLLRHKSGCQVVG